MAQGTHSPDPTRIRSGAGTAATQAAEAQRFADPENGGWSTTPPVVAPTLTSVTPNTGSATTKPPQFDLVGTGFVTGLVFFNMANLNTTLDSPTTAHASPPVFAPAEGVTQVFVTIPDGAGGTVQSNTLPFTWTA